MEWVGIGIIAVLGLLGAGGVVAYLEYRRDLEHQTRNEARDARVEFLAVSEKEIDLAKEEESRTEVKRLRRELRYYLAGWPSLNLGFWLLEHPKIRIPLPQKSWRSGFTNYLS